MRRLLFAALASSAVLSNAQDTWSVAELLDRAGRYVRKFEQDLSVVIADESYQQLVTSAVANGALASRRTKAEFAFIDVPDEHKWIALRNVVEVNGRAVADRRGRIEAILRGSASGRQSRIQALADDSARYNIGGLYRNFNDPTLAALFLDPEAQGRFSFWQDGSETIDGVKTVRLAYREMQTPTAIRRGDVDLFSSGNVWVDESGRIVRTTLRVTDSERGVTGNVTVTFRVDPRLGFLVPYRMDEAYLQVSGQRITSVATYSNVRRFETSSRIVEPKQ